MLRSLGGCGEGRWYPGPWSFALCGVCVRGCVVVCVVVFVWCLFVLGHLSTFSSA